MRSVDVHNDELLQITGSSRRGHDSVTDRSTNAIESELMNLLLLDVDGVLNACPIWDPTGADRDCPWPGGWKEFRAGGYNIKFAPDLCDALLDIHDSGLAEVRWLTTWGHEANAQLAESFGFPHFQVVGVPPTWGETQGWWKFPLAVAATALARRVVWADDDLPRSPEALAWAQSTFTVLPLTPEPFLGLTPADLEKAIGFLMSEEGEEGDRGQGPCAA
jgi:hypothetical protein